MIVNENFGFEQNINIKNDTDVHDKTDLDTGIITSGDKNDLDNPDDDNTDKSNSSKIDNNNNHENDSNSDSNEDVDNLEEGTIIEFDNTEYTVDANGNLLDKDGNIFKKAEEVKDFIKDNDLVDNDAKSSEIDMAAVLKEVGIDILDDEDKPVVFDNTPQGVASYVKSVLDLKQEEYAVAGVNKLVSDYPIISDFLNYYIANGNSAEGFESMPDRSNIVVDEKDVSQQEAIVRQASKEFGRRVDDSYIQYLKDSGKLFEVAKADLASLQEADAEVRKRNAQMAADLQKENDEKLMAYWTSVKNIVDSREIAGYKIPETIIIERDGKKVSTTPEDFFNYIYQVDNEGYSRYQRELENESPEKRINDELLKAWFKYTGKSYDSLVEMAIANKEVKRLKLAANKNKTAKQTIKITKPKTKSVSDNETFGY